MNYPSCNVLDQHILCFLEWPIVSIEEPAFYLEATNYVGAEIKIWNKNKWYAWACRGHIDNYHWSDKMPSRKVLNKLRSALEDFNSPENIRFRITEKMISAYTGGDLEKEEFYFQQLLSKGLV